MPSRIERFLSYLTLLKTGRPFNAAQLADATGVHRRTIFRDVAALRQLGIKITFDEANASYLLDPTHDVGALVNADELLAVLAACRVSEIAGLTTSHGLRHTIAKLANLLSVEERRRFAVVEDESAVGTHSTTSPDILEPIFKAIRTRLPVVVRLRDDASETDRRLAPLALSFRIDGWILTALAEPDGRAVEWSTFAFASARVGASPIDWPRITAPSRGVLPKLEPKPKL